jgi:ABC-type antimicrobial peptide transport system permease subunit
MNRQMDYIQNKNLGFNREQVISINLNEDFRNQFEAMKNYLLQYPGIKNMSRATLGPNAILYSNPVYWEGRGPEQYENMSYVVVDYDYLKTFEFELVEGRNFSKEFSTDGGNYIVNEAAIKFMHLDSPIGKMFSIWQAEGKIIGVVKNFHSLSLHNEIRPVVMTMIPFMPPTQAFIRISPESTKTTLATIEDAWNQFAPNYPFQFEFLDDAFKRQYKNEQKIKTLFQAFSALAIFISCIGLFGLAAFIAQRRTKEIGIRKVVGASVWQLLILLSKDFTRWIVVATLIACPIAWYVMKQWLQNFAYRVEMSWWIYGLAGVMTLGIAWLTICWQAIRVAKANPVESLRYE